MTKLCYDGTRWSSEILLFRSFNRANGPLATRHGIAFGATSAYALLGPDIEAAGGATHNPPRATGAGWDRDWTHKTMGGPDVCFTNDMAEDWKRGHLINGEWGGSGDVWTNLVPLTAGANSNHSSIENRLKSMRTEFHRFDRRNSGHQPYWYCIRYWVQASQAPWSINDDADELYSYCPNMIKVSWRVMRLTKPVGAPGTTASAHLTAAQSHIRNPPIGALTPATATQLANDGIVMPTGVVPAVLVNSIDNQGEAGGAVYPLPAGAPALGIAGTYDGSVEVFQS